MAQPLVDASSHTSEENQAQPSGQRIAMSAFAAQKATKSPFVDVTKRNHEPAREESKLISTTSNGRGVSPPSKRLKMDYGQRKPSRQLNSSQPSRSSGYPTIEKEADEGQPGHGLVHALETSPTKAGEGRPSFLLTETERDEAGSKIEREDYDSTYSTDVEEEVRSQSHSDNDVIVPRQVPNQQLSTFTPNTKNVLGETDVEWTIRLECKDVLCLIGQYDLWVRKGAVSILGAILHPSSSLHRVYAPSTQSLPSIRPIDNPYGPAQQATEITINSCDSRLRLLRHLSPKFGRIWNKSLSHNAETPNATAFSCRSFNFLKTSAEDGHKRPLRLVQPLSDRQLLINRVLTCPNARPGSVMVCGPKSSGKSTLCRMLVNAMLTRPKNNTSTSGIPSGSCVAFLDLDPGQPDYSPPGELSLILLRSCNLGPPFTHPMVVPGSGDELIRAHHLGSLSSKDNPAHYVRCALDLLSHYRKLLMRYPSCPLVINSAGWVNGIGLEILLDIIQSGTISDIVYTSNRGPLDAVRALNEAATSVKAQMHYLDSQEPLFTLRTAKDLRQMQTLSYFHLTEPEIGNLRWDAKPLTEHLPITVHWAGDRQGLFAVTAYNDDVDPEHLLTVLDGCIVGLVVLEDDTALPGNTEPETNDDARGENEPRATESSESIRADHFAVARVESPGDSDSESESVTTSTSSFNVAKHNRIAASEPDRQATDLASHLGHPSVGRNSFEVPYLMSDGRFSGPIDPLKSHSIGQALVRSINLRTKCFHLLTPIFPGVLQTLHRQQRKIVLVRGKLDTPTWAYLEEWQRGAALRQKLKKEDPADAAIRDAADRRDWAEGTPFVSLPNANRVNSASAAVWKVQRGTDAEGLDSDSDGPAGAGSRHIAAVRIRNNVCHVSKAPESGGRPALSAFRSLQGRSLSSSIGDLGAPELDRNGCPRDEEILANGPDSAALDAALAKHAETALKLQSPSIPSDDGRDSRSSSKEPGSRKRSYKVPGDDGGCVSCTISIPEDIRSKLPSGAPGSPRPDGSGRNGSPVLRSKEAVHACGSQHSDSSIDEEVSLQQGSPESFDTDSSPSSCHSHTLEFVTTSKPMKSNTYSLLRRASIRTLSCEQLPRGLTAGRIFFGDPAAGYTVAYKFRLTDPYARGRQRHYALLALAGHDPGRAFKATPVIWRAFERIATTIVASTERAMHHGRSPSSESGEKSRAAPISSFLTQRTTDPDGLPRRSGGAGMRARGLAEMVGNDLFFAELHRSFVALLQCLGRQFGGMVVEPPVSDQELSEGFYEGHDDDGSYLAGKLQQRQKASSISKAVAVA